MTKRWRHHKTPFDAERARERIEAAKRAEQEQRRKTADVQHIARSLRKIREQNGLTEALTRILLEGGKHP